MIFYLIALVVWWDCEKGHDLFKKMKWGMKNLFGLKGRMMKIAQMLLGAIWGDFMRFRWLGEEKRTEEERTLFLVVGFYFS